MQKEGGCKYASGARKKILKVKPSRTSETLFWNVAETLCSSLISSQGKSICSHRNLLVMTVY